MASEIRIKRGIYTEADVQALYMKYRESGFGSFVREVGDFIAHSKRDRGATLDGTAYIFAQLAFFQTYQGTKKQPLDPKGKCGWWLKHYLLTKTKETPDTEIQKAANLTKKQAMNAIKSWFPENVAYPTEIKCSDPTILFNLATLFCQYLVSKDVFTIATARSEIAKMFDSESIDHSEMDRFLIATAVLLNGKTTEIVPGVTSTIGLRVEVPRRIHLPKQNNEGLDNFITLPDGNLKIEVSTDNKSGDGLIGTGSNFLDTGIDTELYFSRSLVESDDHNFPLLNLDRRFSFDSTASPNVNPV